MDEQKQPQATPGQDSLAPVGGVPKRDVGAEAAAMNKGKSRHLWGAAGTAVVLGVGALIMLQYINRGTEYAEAANAVAAVEEQDFVGYFTCALQGTSTAQLSSMTRVRSVFETAGDRLGKELAATLKSCEPRIDALARKVQELPIPSALSEKREALSAAVAKLKSAQAAYQTYLADPAETFSFEKAGPLIKDIGQAWQDYRDAHTDLHNALQEGI